MERLQKALQKAREQRSGQGLAIAGRGGAAAAPQVVPTDTAWELLAPCDPDPGLLERNRIVTTRAGRMAAPFDILRTKVLLTMRKNGWSRLAITSPTAACGKTTTACNLAMGFSRQHDVRAILFEFDLRKPTIARNLDLPDAPDISQMLSGEVDFADQALRYKDNVAISAARHPSDDPTAVLLSHATHETLARVEETYKPDLTIFDLPPVLASDDARAFLKDVDCALLVTRAESTHVSQIDASEREIAEQTNVLGLLLNQSRHGDDVQAGYNSYGVDG